MPTSGIILARNFVLHSNTAEVNHLTSCSINADGEVIDITSNDSSNWKDGTIGDLGWSMEMEAFVAFDATEGIDEIWADYIARTPQTVLVSTGVSGDSTWSGSANITNVSIDSNRSDAVKFKVTYTGTGVLTKGTVGA